MSSQETNCSFKGSADMYGMGIRIGYYLQWYGSIISAWIAPEESNGLRIANSLFVTATFLALVIMTVRQHSSDGMFIVETYVILFLTFGSYLVLVPIYIWRLFTGCKPLWDPTRFPRVSPGRVYKICNALILISVLVFQTWFWAHQVPKLNDEECKRYGFFFTKFVLNSKDFRALNLATSIVLLLICLTTVGMVTLKIWFKISPMAQYVRLDGATPNWIHILQYLDSISQAMVTTVIIVGVELTITWNKIEGVHDINSAGQTIPLFLGIGTMVVVFYVKFFKREAEEALAGDNNADAGPSQNPSIAGPRLRIDIFSAVGARSTAEALHRGSSRPTHLKKEVNRDVPLLARPHGDSINWC